MTLTLLEDLDAASVSLGRVSVDVAAFRALSESELLELNRVWANVNRTLGTTGALIAGEIARRSAPQLGSEGLARRSGLRTPEQFIKVTTGMPAQQATTAVRVGTLVIEAAGEGLVDVATGEVGTPSKPWLTAVAEAVRSGRLSTAAADSITSGLGFPTSGVTVDALRQAATTLCAEAIGTVMAGTEAIDVDGRPGLDADSLFKRARQLRDELDLDGVKLREQERFEQRGIKYTRFPTGMSRLVWDMDPETDASVKQLFDRATSPKLGGVRFVDATQAALSKAIVDDNRTPAQLASDAFLQLLLQGSDAPTDFLLGSGAPIIRIAATRKTVDTRRGLAHIEGATDAVSVDTLERHLCGGTQETTYFNESSVPLDMGRDQRLFTQRQKGVLALKWGGCAHPDCDRPPSWTEAHHIRFFRRDNGKTDIADGILLCKYHHLLFHNRGWEIERDHRGQYWLQPPGAGDGKRGRILLEPKGRVVRDLERESASEAG
jgi:hypothetical protein